jgi:NAD(P)-dependent dehydrogenase (short-subunit alcohol dehydrogenase family)
MLSGGVVAAPLKFARSGNRRVAEAGFVWHWLSMDMELQGRQVVVTGGVGGLGGAVVDAIVAAGAMCHLPVRERSARPSDGSRRYVDGVDLTEERAVAAFYAGCPPLWASVHLAGGYGAAAFLETGLADLRKQVDLNLVTAFLCCREAARNIRDRSGGAGGRLVNVGSRAAAVPAGGSIAYTVSKAAVAVLTQALAVELGPQSIAVNAIVPSTIDTPANRAAMPKADHDRWPKPDEIARAVVWLISPQQTVTSGALLPVYGRSP